MTQCLHACYKRQKRITDKRVQTFSLAQAAQKFAGQLQTGHNAGCPWNGNACDEQLASYPPLPQAQVESAYRERVAGLQKLSHLPAIADPAVDKLAETHRQASLPFARQIVSCKR